MAKTKSKAKAAQAKANVVKKGKSQAEPKVKKGGEAKSTVPVEPKKAADSLAELKQALGMPKAPKQNAHGDPVAKLKALDLPKQVSQPGSKAKEKTAKLGPEQVNDIHAKVLALVKKPEAPTKTKDNEKTENGGGGSKAAAKASQSDMTNKRKPAGNDGSTGKTKDVIVTPPAKWVTRKSRDSSIATTSSAPSRAELARARAEQALLSRKDLQDAMRAAAVEAEMDANNMQE